MPIDISGNGATQAIYLQMSGVVIQYSVGTLTTPGIWNDISGTTWPATITNSNPGASTILRVIATQSLTILTSTSYFIVGTTYITFDGSGNTITMSNLSNYPGLIQNGTNLVVGKANIIVQNFNIVGSGASTETNQNGGWLCQAYYGRASLANYITNCTNAARITRNNAGGLFGVYAGSYTGATMFITNCSNSADMTTATQGRCGGICGQSAGSLGGVLTFTNCMNTGLISTAESGGIVGANAGGENTGGVTFTNCTNTGNITGAKSGGIVGSYFGSFYTTTPLITNTITTCTNTGNITGQYAGGIAGWSFGFNTTSTQSITNSYSTGDISGNNAGGIVGANIGSNTSATYGASVVNITNCYSLGPIRTTAGGICGGWDSVAYVRIASVTITNSYSSGALFGTGTGLVAVALTSSQITLTTPATYVAAGAWTDASANASLTGTPTNISTNNPGTTWTMVTAGTQYVLSAYNAALYSPSSATWDANWNIVYTSAPGLFQSGYTYKLLYNIAANPGVARVFVSKGTAPFYNSYNSNTFTLTNTAGDGVISATINASTGVLSFILAYPCFLEGTKILCFENNEEVYRPIESLQKGDLVKTIYNGYMPVNMMGTTKVYNPGNDYRTVNRIYKCPKENYPTLFEDLYITGCHSILVPAMTDDQWENTKAINKTIYVTDNHFRLIAYADEKAEPYNKEGFMNIYHVALDHHDIYMNYGIYANGLLVESCSIECLIYSNMKLMGKDESVVSQDGDNVFNNMTQQLVQTC
jgi:hypothetical protein